jgi:hypothetical protein
MRHNQAALDALGRQKFIRKVRHSHGEPQPPRLIGIRPSLFTLRLLSWQFVRIQADIPIPGDLPARSATANDPFIELVHPRRRSTDGRGVSSNAMYAPAVPNAGQSGSFAACGRLVRANELQ